MATNPVNGKLYVTNTEANNMTRFEGAGKHGGSTVQGKIALSRVTVINNGVVTPRYLNKHIDYTKLANDPGFDTTAKQHSLATPTDIAVSKNGLTTYVAAYGSSRIGVFNTAALENDTFNPRSISNGYIKQNCSLCRRYDYFNGKCNRWCYTIYLFRDWPGWLHFIRFHLYHRNCRPTK